MDDEPYQEVYFIGITLPTDLDRQVAKLKNRLYQADTELLQPVLPHVTLLHPPSLSGILPSELIPKVRQVAERYLPLTVALNDIGSFGSSVIFLEAESLKLRSLQTQLVKLLPPEAQASHYRRPYRPHVTIAQKYEPKCINLDAIGSKIVQAVELPQTFTVENVTCFKRILPRRYRPEDI